MRNRAEAVLIGALLALFRALPRTFAERFARFAFACFDRAAPRLRRTAERNFELAWPELSLEERAKIVDGVWWSLARLLTLLARFPRITKDNVGEYIEYEGYEHFERAKAAGRGILFATAHLGNWELSAFAHALMAEPMTVVVRPLDNPILDEWSVRYRTMSGNQVVGRGKDFLRPLLAALHRNEAVGILIDQNVTADRGVFIDFFGRKACVDSGLARLAARTGAAVIPGYAVWNPGRGKYTLHFDPPVAMSGEAVEDTQRIHARLEAAIRRHPGQWLWIHRRWKTRPAGEGPLY